MSQSSDLSEQEADRVADQVMRMPEPVVQRQCAACVTGGAPCSICKKELVQVARKVDRLSTSDVPSSVYSALSSAGQPLSSSTRAFFEPRLGMDLGHVRVHTDGEAQQSAREVNALAYTVGSHVVFDPGRYNPGTSAGQRLLAHELTHVAQQQSRERISIGDMIHRQVAGAETSQPTVIEDASRDQVAWLRRVDRAVRSQFGVRGAGLTGSRVEFVDSTEFGRRLSPETMEEMLYAIFLDYGEDHRSQLYHILDYNREPFRIAGVTSTALASLRAFIQAGIRQGYFEGQTREIEVATGERFPVFRLTPGELIATYVGGHTDIAGPRSSRRIVVQHPTFVTTLVHETCHYYISEQFRDMAGRRPDRERFLRGARMGQVLEEGFAEYFAREVMETNRKAFGLLNGQPYQPEVEVVWALIATLGEASVRQAYFHGERAQLDRLERAIEEYWQTPEGLFVPSFMVDQPEPIAPRIR